MNSGKTSILVCGDAGPARHALLSRSDVEVMWADTAAAAAAALGPRAADLCLISPRHVTGDALELLEMLLSRANMPCVVLLGEDDWDQEGVWLRAGATEVVELGRSDLVTRVIGELTELKFAVEQRTDFRTVVEVRYDGEELVLESANLSASGAAIRGFPSAEVGTLVRVSFVVQNDPVVLWARVVRTWSDDEDSYAGLRFAGVSERQRRSIRQFVYDRNAVQPGPSVELAHLLGEIKARTANPDEAPEAVESPADEPGLVTGYLTASAAERDAMSAPLWLRRVLDSLTDVEVDAVLKTEQPSWAREVVEVRLELARWRATNGRAAPSALAVRAYASFCNLAHAAADESDDVQAQVGVIRAAVLRELLTITDVRRDVPQSVPPPAPTSDLLDSMDLSRIQH